MPSLPLLIPHSTDAVKPVTGRDYALYDTDESHVLYVSCGSDLTADRVLSILTGDSGRTLTLSGNATLDDWFDQSVKQAASPTFAALTVTGAVTGSNLNVSNWDTAYGWGNHAGLYDAAGTAAGAVGTHESTYSHANFATAYGWGNHASAGYAVAGGAYHDGFSDFVANEHINWTSTSSNFSTSGTAGTGNLTVNGTQVIDATNTEALLVRKDADDGDVFVVDTTNVRVGINCTPSRELDILGNAFQIRSGSAYNPQIYVQNYLDGSSAGYVNFGKARGTIASPSDVQASDAIGTFVGQAYSSSALRNACGFGFAVEGSPSGANVPGRITFFTNNGTAYGTRMYLTAAGGLVVGAPTGGDKGAGTINANAVYDDNVLLTDHVFDIEFGGEAKPEDRGKLRVAAYKRRTIKQYAQHLKTKRHLPAVPGREAWDGDTKPSVGEFASAMLEELERLAVYVVELEERLSALESA
jgi:hypothetical protein